VSGHYPNAFIPRKNPLVPTELEAGWAQEPSGHILENKKSLDLAGDRNLARPVLVTILTELSRLMPIKSPWENNSGETKRKLCELHG